MNKLKPFVDSLLYDTIIPLLFITEVEAKTFDEEPVDYIRNLMDFNDSPKT